MTAAEIIALCKARGVTLSAAESCTGGLVAKLLTDVPGASAVFSGGVVSYTNAVKARVLGVPEDLLTEYGAVSAPVAKAMAQGVRRVIGTDVGLSVTGVAGPDRDDRGNPVGTVFLGLSDAGGTAVQALHLEGDRAHIRAAAAQQLFTLLAEHLKEE